MAVESLSQRPIFASEENEYLVPNRPPMSRLAIVALLLGLASCVVLVKPDAIALPVIAITLGLMAYIQVARDEGLSGGRVALLGLGLGLAFAVCALTSAMLRDRYLFGVSSQFAVKYLETLASGKVLEAYELMQPEPQRQVAGSALEEYYRQAEEPIRTGMETFKNDPKSLEVRECGKSAQWKFVRGESIRSGDGRDLIVTIRMVDASKNPGKEFEVILERSISPKPTEDASASWHIAALR